MRLIKRITAVLAVTVFIIGTYFTAYAEETKAPDVKALGAVLVDGKTGRVLWEKNADKELANASTTKIMTCMLALESGRLDETVTVSSNAAIQPKVKMGLSTGEKLRFGDLLYPLMLQSSNDAAVAIAEHLGGDVESFCNMMNERAEELGAVNTCFETPNGLDSGNHHSTAYDMAVIARQALQTEGFKDIISTPHKEIKSDRCTYSVVNKNRLLREYDGAIGIKTGFTGKAGNCFVGAAERDGMQLISVVLGSGWGNVGKERKWIDTKNILNYGFENFDYYTLCGDGDIIAEIPVEKSYGKKIKTAVSGTIILPLSKAEKEALYAELDMPETATAPVSKGDVIGRILFKTDSETTVAKCNIIAENGAEKKNMKTTAEMLIKHWINAQKSAILKDNAKLCPNDG